MIVATRRFAGPSDITLLAEWVRQVRPPERATDYPSVFELPQLLQLPHNQQTARLWFAETGELIGFAFADVFRTLRFELDWRLATPAIEDAIVAWGDECLSHVADARLLYATAHEADTRRLAFLSRHAFTRLPDAIVHLERMLDLPIADLPLPPGFAMRPVAGEHEAAALATLHRAAFGTAHMTTERRLAMMRTPQYQAMLDLVVVAPDGSLAAYAMGSVSSEENALTGRNACYADLFATHPAYRGHGLARALLAHLLRLLNARGYALAKLNTSSENAPMRQAATSEGFVLASTTLRFARAVAC